MSGSRLLGFLRALLKGLDIVSRIVVSVMVLGLIGAGLLMFSGGGVMTPSVPQHAILKISLSGDLVEKPSPAARGRALAQVFSRKEPETVLGDVIEALNLAARDPAIVGVHLDTGSLAHAGLASLHEIAQAVDHFRASGKPVTAWSEAYTQAQYAVASHASEVYLHPMGEVRLKGLTSRRLYWGGLLERLGVHVHVFKAGDYKSFPEIFVRRGPSEEANAAERAWLEEAWSRFAGDIEKARGLMPGAIMQLIDHYPKELQRAGGEMSRLALEHNLVDGLMTLPALEAKLTAAQRAAIGSADRLHVVDYLDYLDARLPRGESGRGVALVTLEGEIVDGESGIGQVGGDDTATLLQEVLDDEQCAAVVVRVNSPGGSAVASEEIRTALQQLRESGKPVVVSMGDAAASGGYWLSLAANEIVADPLSITGSIGVFGLAPTFEKTLAQADVGTGGVSTAWLAGAESALTDMDPRLTSMITMTVESTYRQFVRLAAESRRMKPEAMQALAQGRVYTGAQAVSLGLADRTGDTDTALARARELAGLAADAPVYVFDDTPDLITRLLDRLLVRVREVLVPREATRALAAVARPFAGLPARFPLPGEGVKMSAHCLCTPGL